MLQNANCRLLNLDTTSDSVPLLHNLDLDTTSESLFFVVKDKFNHMHRKTKEASYLASVLQRLRVC